MKVILINGSPNANGCTYTGLSIIKEQLAKNGVASEIYQVGTKPIAGCIACRKCKQTGECVFDDDLVNKVAQELKEADRVVVKRNFFMAGKKQKERAQNAPVERLKAIFGVDSIKPLPPLKMRFYA